MKIRKLLNPTKEEIEQMTEVMHIAFDKEIYCYGCGGEENSKKCIRVHILAGLVGGEVYVAEENDEQDQKAKIVGALIVFPPGTRFLASPEQRQSGWDDFIAGLKPEYQAWWPPFRNEYDALCEDSYGKGGQNASWHMLLAGVSPQYQKGGFFSGCLRLLYEKASEGKTTITLETEGEELVTIYKRFGFRVAGEREVGGFKVVCMILDPQSKPQQSCSNNNRSEVSLRARL